MARPRAAWHGDETTARAANCTEAYHALLASKAGAVRWWEHDGATAVVKDYGGALLAI